MGDYFKPWQRKFGVLTLMIALVATVGWVRSMGDGDQIRCNAFPKETLQSTVGQICWWSGQTPKIPNRYFVDWVTFRTPVRTWAAFHTPNNTFHLWMDMGVIVSEDEGFVVCIPYWFITIPLTVISAYLLLKKPKTSTEKKTTLPIQHEGGAAS